MWYVLQIGLITQRLLDRLIRFHDISYHIKYNQIYDIYQYISIANQTLYAHMHNSMGKWGVLEGILISYLGVYAISNNIKIYRLRSRFERSWERCRLIQYHADRIIPTGEIEQYHMIERVVSWVMSWYAWCIGEVGSLRQVWGGIRSVSMF